MKIKLTNRGKFVITALLGIGVFAVLGFALYMVAMAANHHKTLNNPPKIICQTDTVLQSDGSCSPMEN